MGTVKIRPNEVYVLVVNFWMKAVTMATCHLITGRYIPHFGLNSEVNSLIFILSYRDQEVMGSCRD